MARAAQEPFVEDVHVMKTLYQEYSKRVDADAMTAVDQELRELVKACNAAEADVRQTIKELSKQAQELEGAAAYPHREGLHAERMAALQRQIDMAKQLISELNGHTRSTSDECEEVEKHLAAIAEKAEESAAFHDAAVTTLKNYLSLYAHITKTRWWEDSSKISGVVSDVKKSDIRPFTFDKDIDKFELINKLWELL